MDEWTGMLWWELDNFPPTFVIQGWRHPARKDLPWRASDVLGPQQRMRDMERVIKDQKAYIRSLEEQLLPYLTPRAEVADQQTLG